MGFDFLPDLDHFQNTLPYLQPVAGPQSPEVNAAGKDILRKIPGLRRNSCFLGHPENAFLHQQAHLPGRPRMGVTTQAVILLEEALTHILLGRAPFAANTNGHYLTLIHSFHPHFARSLL